MTFWRSLSGWNEIIFRFTNTDTWLKKSCDDGLLPLMFETHGLTCEVDNEHSNKAAEEHVRNAKMTLLREKKTVSCAAWFRSQSPTKFYSRESLQLVGQTTWRNWIIPAEEEKKRSRRTRVSAAFEKPGSSWFSIKVTNHLVALSDTAALNMMIEPFHKTPPTPPTAHKPRKWRLL